MSLGVASFLRVWLGLDTGWDGWVDALFRFCVGLAFGSVLGRALYDYIRLACWLLLLSSSVT